MRSFKSIWLVIFYGIVKRRTGLLIIYRFPMLFAFRGMTANFGFIQHWIYNSSRSIFLCVATLVSKVRREWEACAPLLALPVCLIKPSIILIQCILQALPVVCVHSLPTAEPHAKKRSSPHTHTYIYILHSRRYQISTIPRAMLKKNTHSFLIPMLMWYTSKGIHLGHLPQNAHKMFSNCTLKSPTNHSPIKFKQIVIRNHPKVP